MSKINTSDIIKDIDLRKPSSWEKTVIGNINLYNKDENLSKIKDVAILELKHPGKNNLDQYFSLIGIIAGLFSSTIIILKDFENKQSEWVGKLENITSVEQVKGMIDSTSKNYEAIFGIIYNFAIWIIGSFVLIMIINILFDNYIVNRKKKITVLISIIDSKVNNEEIEIPFTM